MTGLQTFEVRYVYLDESTPRDIHAETVTAVDVDDARLVLFGTAPEERLSVVAVTPTEENQ